MRIVFVTVVAVALGTPALALADEDRTARPGETCSSILPTCIDNCANGKHKCDPESFCKDGLWKQCLATGDWLGPHVKVRGLIKQ